MKRRFFAQEFTGLNTASAGHLIGHSDFQIAENVSYEEIGAATPLEDDATLWTTESQGQQGIYAVRYGGNDHVIAVVDSEVYEDGAVVSGLTLGPNTPAIISDGDKIYLFDGETENTVYDGIIIRNHGAPAKPRSTTDAAAVVLNPDGTSVSATASVSPTVFDTLAEHGLSNGDIILFGTMTGGSWGGLDGLQFAITVVDEDSFSIDHDSSTYGLLSDGSYSIVGPAVGMSYKYAVSTVVTLPGGEEIESSLVDLWYLPDGFEATNGTPTRDPVVLSAGQDLFIVVDLAGNPLTGYVSPTTGSSFKMVVYRTKGNGDTYYVLREIESSEMTAGYGFSFKDTITDADLGAAWLFDLDSNDSPPVGTMAVICQQQMFVAGVLAYPNRLYYSGIGRYDYFAPLDYIECRDAITGLAEMGDRVAVFSDSGIGAYVPDEVLGQYKRSLSPVGIEAGNSCISTNLGVIFARPDGLWLFDGNSSSLINGAIADDWPSGTWSLAYITNRLVATNGAREFVMDIGGGKMRWTEVISGVSRYVSSAHDGSVLYGIDSAGVMKSLFTASARTMKVRSRNWGGGGSWRGMWAVVDGTATGNFTVRVRSSSGDLFEYVMSNVAFRERYRVSIPRSVKGDYLSVEVEGDIVVYQIELVVD